MSDERDAKGLNAVDMLRTDFLADTPRRSVRDLIAEKLAVLISSGVLDPGDELPGERELAASLSVSRATIRGAISILAAHDILRVSHGARTVVSSRNVAAVMPPVTELETPADPGVGLEEVHEARLLVEREIGARAAERTTPALLFELEASIAAQEACRDDPVSFLLCDREFHARFYAAGGNAVMTRIAMGLYNHMLDHRRRIVAEAGSIDRSIADHRAILQALERGNGPATAAAAVTHATRIFDTTRRFLQTR